MTLSTLGGVAARHEMAIAQLAQLGARHFKPAFIEIDRRNAGAGLAKLRAVARPMPPPPPVTTQTRPERPSQSDESVPVMCDHSYLVN